MWWWRLIVFAESARRRRRILFLLSLDNPCSDYFQIFAVCILLALGNLPGDFFCVFHILQQNPRWPPKSYVALWSLNRFTDLFHVWFKGTILPWTCAEIFWCDSGNKIKTLISLRFLILADISVLLILTIIKIW